MKKQLFNFRQANSFRAVFNKMNFLILFLSIIILTYSGCKKDEMREVSNPIDKQSIEEKFKDAGFDVSKGMVKYKDGYIIERDIFITEKQLDKMLGNEFNKGLLGRKGLSGKMPNDNKINHFRTNDLLTLGIAPKSIKIYLKSEVGHLGSELLDAISRFNNLGLRISFSTTTNLGNADIVISGDSSLPYYMLSGFPSSGNPYGEIIVNTTVYHAAYPWYDTASTLAHEIGHAIGFRHSDYMDRSFSCGGAYDNEGSAGVGDVHIPGTPTGPSSASWMLSCVSGYDRPFTGDDITAIQELYGYNKIVYVKVISTLNYDNSYFSTYNDYVDISTHYKLEFYKNSAHTISYTTANSFFINVAQYTNGVLQWTSILIPDGLTEYELGDYNEVINREFGTDVYNNSSGLMLTSGQLYY